MKTIKYKLVFELDTFAEFEESIDPNSVTADMLPILAESLEIDEDLIRFVRLEVVDE